jgi:hypothetical protein
VKHQYSDSNRDEPGYLVASASTPTSRGKESFLVGVGISIADLWEREIIYRNNLIELFHQDTFSRLPCKFFELAFKYNIVIPKLGEYNQEIWDNLCSLNA